MEQGRDRDGGKGERRGGGEREIETWTENQMQLFLVVKFPRSPKPIFYFY
jgi:hypothetical protein